MGSTVGLKTWLVRLVSRMHMGLLGVICVCECECVEDRA